jgi:phosphatidylethanolamine-binding protein (PEBP) family uncharacterized protein
MRRWALMILGAALVPAFALSGCASQSSGPATIELKSAAVIGNVLPARYTCDGQDTWPPLEWGSVPSGTRELALVMLALATSPTTGRYQSSVAWAMAGVNPALHRIASGELPAGAHLALTESGAKQRYSICPAKNRSGLYQFALYAIPPAITIPPRFVAGRLFAVIANPQSKHLATGGGSFIANYKRAARPARSRAGGSGG